VQQQQHQIQKEMPYDPVAQLNAIMENMKKINENPMGANQF